MQNQLTAKSIVNCAKMIMSDEGKVPSIRRISSELNVDAMAIYHYFSNKADLLRTVAVSLVSEIYEPQSVGAWQVELEKLCKSYLTLLNNYSGLLETMLGMTSYGPATEFERKFGVAVHSLNLNDRDKKDALDLLADYLHGFALAMSCCENEQTLSIDMLDGALRIYIKGLVSL
jgi:AcrR family transcriptional regulator